MKNIFNSRRSGPMPGIMTIMVLGAFPVWHAGSSSLMAQVGSDELQQAIEIIRQIEPGGLGHEPAVAAIQILNGASAAQVPELLQAMDGTNPLAANWLRGAIQSALAGSSEVPREAIRAFLDDQQRPADGRLMAYELLVADQPELAENLLPGLVDDPCLRLRYKAIAWLIERDKQDTHADVRGLIFALLNARDVSQIQEIARRLDQRNIYVDLQKTLGVVSEWQIAGAFDNREEKGFDVPHGPELNLANIDTSASYQDTIDQQTVGWIRHVTNDPNGIVNLNELLGNLKGATAYATAQFNAAEDAECQIRIGCINAHKVWLNGTELINNEIYHVGMMPDQFSGTGRLKQGPNTILIKVCQNEQEQPWAQDWMFQLRICTPDGAAIQPAAGESADE